MPYIEACEDGYGVSWTKTEHYASDNEEAKEEVDEDSDEEQGEDCGYIAAFLASRGNK